MKPLRVIPPLLAAILYPPAAGAVDHGQIDIEPAARDTYTVDFVSRTLTTATVSCAVVKGSDGSPSTMISGSPAAGGSYVTFVLAPGNARKGNSYQCVVQPTDTDGNQPIANIRVDVKKTVIVP